MSLATAQFVMVLDQSAMNVSISELVADFDTTVTVIQAVITLYCLVMAMFMLTGGKIGDMIGRSRGVRGRAGHLRLRIGGDGGGADGGHPRLGVVGARGPRRRARASGDGGADRGELRGRRAKGGVRGDRRGRRGGDRGRPDRRRLGDDRAVVAHRVRRRGRARGIHPRDDALHRRRARSGREASWTGWARRCRRAASASSCSGCSSRARGAGCSPRIRRLSRSACR